MLQTLKNRNASEIQFVLSNLATQVLPNARYSESQKTTADYSDVIAEIRQRLNLSQEDQSYRAITKIQKTIADEITQSIYAGIDLSVVKSRLGQKGQLSQNLYTFKFADIYNKFGGVGVRKSAVLELLKKPDQSQHLHPEFFQEDAEKSVSLFTKTTICEDENKNYTLLVSAQRKGFVQHISEAWKIYHSEVDLSHAELPEEVLRAFVDRFGLEISIANKVGKFFWNETHPLKQQGETDLIKIMETPIPKFVTFVQFLPTENSIRISHAYAVNLDKYWDSLRSHGMLIEKRK
jgi:hypothetical protein